MSSNIKNVHPVQALQTLYMQKMYAFSIIIDRELPIPGHICPRVRTGWNRFSAKFPGFYDFLDFSWEPCFVIFFNIIVSWCVPFQLNIKVTKQSHTRN